MFLFHRYQYQMLGYDLPIYSTRIGALALKANTVYIPEMFTCNALHLANIELAYCGWPKITYFVCNFSAISNITIINFSILIKYYN